MLSVNLTSSFEEAEKTHVIDMVYLAMLQRFKDSGFKKKLQIYSFAIDGVSSDQIPNILDRLTDIGLVVSTDNGGVLQYVISRAGEIEVEKHLGIDSYRVECTAALTLLRKAKVLAGLHVPHIEEMSDDRQLHIIKELEKDYFLEKANFGSGDEAINASIITRKGERYLDDPHKAVKYTYGGILSPDFSLT